MVVGGSCCTADVDLPFALYDTGWLRLEASLRVDFAAFFAVWIEGREEGEGLVRYLDFGYNELLNLLLLFLS